MIAGYAKLFNSPYYSLKNFCRIWLEEWRNTNEETEKTWASSPKPTKWRFRSSSCSPSHRKRNCQNGRSPYKFYPAQQGENLVHLRGWLPLIKQIAEEIGMDYVEKRSPTKVWHRFQTWRLRCKQDHIPCATYLWCDGILPSGSIFGSERERTF